MTLTTLLLAIITLSTSLTALGMKDKWAPATSRLLAKGITSILLALFAAGLTYLIWRYLFGSPKLTGTSGLLMLATFLAYLTAGLALQSSTKQTLGSRKLSATTRLLTVIGNFAVALVVATIPVIFLGSLTLFPAPLESWEQLYQSTSNLVIAIKENPLNFILTSSVYTVFLFREQVWGGVKLQIAKPGAAKTTDRAET